jgi:hypothetical protein
MSQENVETLRPGIEALFLARNAVAYSTVSVPSMP